MGARSATAITVLTAIGLGGAGVAQGQSVGQPAGSERAWTDARRLAASARRLEREDPAAASERYHRAARLFAASIDTHPRPSAACWRGARALWAAGDVLPVEATTRRIHYFERAEGLSQRGIDVDPDCAECMLWKFASMGRLRTARGVWTGIRGVPEMANLLERGIALASHHADDDRNSTLGNLHYSSAIFYRVLPDWFFVGWVLGVRGDKERALDHARTALVLHPARLDYRIELGSQLLCLGSTRGDPTQLENGRRVLRAAVELPPETQDDAREIAAARIMLAEPAKSCGYTGDTWLEIDRERALGLGSGDGSE